VPQTEDFAGCDNGCTECLKAGFFDLPLLFAPLALGLISDVTKSHPAAKKRDKAGHHPK
jgi:hypothetical protein